MPVALNQAELNQLASHREPDRNTAAVTGMVTKAMRFAAVLVLLVVYLAVARV